MSPLSRRIKPSSPSRWLMPTRSSARSIPSYPLRKKLKSVPVTAPGWSLPLPGISQERCYPYQLQDPSGAEHRRSRLRPAACADARLYRIIPNRTKEEWTRGQHSPIELRGKTAVIVGLGGIGMQIAQRAHAFDIK